jgi:hypothetical protein
MTKSGVDAINGFIFSEDAFHDLSTGDYALPGGGAKFAGGLIPHYGLELRKT